MATAISPDVLKSALFVKLYDHDPGTTNACLASPDGGTTPWYWDMQSYHRILFAVKPSIVGGGGLTLARVFASTDVLGATNATLIYTSGTIALDDMSTSGGDQVVIEITAEQVREVDTSKVGLRYLTLELTQATNTDEAVVCVVGVPVHPRLSLTATQQA